MKVEKTAFLTAVKDLRDCGLSNVPLDCNQPVKNDFYLLFVKAVESVPPMRTDELPGTVSTIYNLLVDQINEKLLAEKNATPDLADMVNQAREKEKEKTEMGKKPAAKPAVPKAKAAAVVKVKAEPKVKPAPPANDPAPQQKVEPIVILPPKIKAETKADLAVAFVKENPGATMYQLKQLPWNTANDSYYNLFNRKIKEGTMRKDGKKYFIV